ncbi:type VII secretion protein EccB [Mycobacterium sp.]|uniref:type VII secretion protein EccB n=1 Tax=Mycobacterium sp. TaxID=1785 RepID=UPI003C72D860
MAREPTTRLAISGHRFLLRRAEHALVRRDVRMVDEPMRAQARSLVTGCALAVVAVAGCAILAFIRPPDALGDAPIVMVRESGALYVRIGDTLHPALNLASARLIAGTAASPQIIKESELRNAKRGALLGIPGAPALLPEPLGADESQWTACDDANGTTVIAGAATGAQALANGRTTLVRSRSDAVTYLLYDGYRARVSLADPAAVKALRLDGIEPADVSSAVLNAIPEAPSITAPVIPAAGQRGPSSLGGIPVGSVVRVDRADADELYVVLAGGVQRVGHVGADIVRFSDSQGARDIVTVAADAIGATPTVETLPITTFPDMVAAPTRDDVVCAQWLPGDTTEGRSTVLTGSAVPLATGQAPVGLAQADGLGPNADAVFVPPGRSVYAESTHRYLIADTGVRFGVPDAESAAALGLPPRALPAPWPILKLLADGPELSRSAALVAHDGVAPDPCAIALPGTAVAPR